VLRLSSSDFEIADELAETASAVQTIAPMISTMAIPSDRDT
jgi:hypothetical protein